MPTGKGYNNPRGGTSKGSATQSPATGATKLHDVSTKPAGKSGGRGAAKMPMAPKVKLAKGKK